MCRFTGEVVACYDIDRSILGLVVHMLTGVGDGARAVGYPDGTSDRSHDEK